MKSKHFFLGAVCICLSAVILLAVPTLYIDPFFHFHPPVEGVSYRLANERYQNDGILRHFSYDAVIIGTSMTQNFKTSEMDALFGTSSIKVPLAGAYNKEIGDRLRRGFASDNEITHVVMSLDLLSLLADKDAVSYDSYPDYLYDDNPLNDVYYLFNKEVLADYTFRSIQLTMAGGSSTSFDDYSNWSDRSKYGREAVLSLYQRPPAAAEKMTLSEQKRSEILDSLYANIISIARENTDTVFYCFIPPYSIVRMDSWMRSGSFDYSFDIFEECARALLAEENIRVFSFYEDQEMICSLDNYRDDIHYGGWINSYILECMAQGSHELDADSLEGYFSEVREYYRGYDYAQLFGQ